MKWPPTRDLYISTTKDLGEYFHSTFGRLFSRLICLYTSLATRRKKTALLACSVCIFVTFVPPFLLYVILDKKYFLWYSVFPRISRILGIFSDVQYFHEYSVLSRIFCIFTDVLYFLGYSVFSRIFSIFLDIQYFLGYSVFSWIFCIFSYIRYFLAYSVLSQILCIFTDI